ncbi:YheC/YheD family protein [Cohnella pontilimi]|uniref:YheC/YheD family protein n=1 Tax=Cohnella pontilimi TaxID=2564100 RepID=A0A4V5LS21_9BACL|nr:YheC/YheD family protein [Cohnella pontilimi]TJY41489.1 YheC/YheD family protein [Cohnella pontilimi]
MSAQPLLGIMTLYLNDRRSLEERKIYEKMTAAGKRRGLQVFVFTPDDVEPKTERIHAMVYLPNRKNWVRRWVRFPHLIYDRCRYQRSARFQRLLEFRKKYGHLTYLNRPLRNKWTIHRTLLQEPAIRPHLPATRLYQSPEDVAAMLKKYPSVYFKPINGTGGRGILRIDRLRGGQLLLQGRDHRRAIVAPRRVRRENLSSVIRSWDLGGDRYIVQQGLNIKLPNGRIHDYRMLVQKNGSGEWEVTGCAGRVGAFKSITSNLHGGGEAASMELLLHHWVDVDTEIDKIMESAESLGIEISKRLEAHFGALCELALDLAIDRNGRVWLIEVNPKPSREVFKLTGEKEIYRKAITRPIEYALWLYGKKLETHSRLHSSLTDALPEEESALAASPDPDVSAED